MAAVQLVAIGASWGGLQAVECVLGALPADFGAAIVVAQHRQAREDHNDRLTSLLDGRCELVVREAEDKQALRPGVVLLAPADYHLLVEPGEVALSVDAPVNFSRPSIDILLRSAADAYGDRVAGVVLTGANADGAEGLARIAARGGAAIVQDPDTAVRREMPDAALATTPAARVAALEEIGPLLVELVRSGARTG
ncbi:MAG: two-component system, chemotaxis family, protein-glutamate methylesterase/glutaminase [Solirubrobacteraceae bacterium]|jgi:two-component system chemotaxis response regulator CheB|nr:two-component system, chemotaxis family, protein-glutamate methylesterase/glutaminase [Solirubrobacteraceae bacterium]